MADGKAAARSEATRSSEESERALGRGVALGLPVAGVLGATVVGFLAGLGSALLVLAATALLGTIALLWASVRTLGGDAPLSTRFEALGARRHGVDALAERKRRVLRALKDLENEHALGKLDDGDYSTLQTRYRDEAKAVMREIDVQVSPLRAEAERVAQAYLAKKGLGDAPASAAPEPQETPVTTGERRTCPACEVSNEADAAFCKKCGASLATASAEGSDARS